MTQTEVIKILKRIAAAYSRFEVTEDRLEIWFEHLLEMPYEGVLERLNKHIAKEKFPPTIAEISVFGSKKNDHLKEVEQWERDAKYANES